MYKAKFYQWVLLFFILCHVNFATESSNVLKTQMLDESESSLTTTFDTEIDLFKIFDTSKINTEIDMKLNKKNDEIFELNATNNALLAEITLLKDKITFFNEKKAKSADAEEIKNQLLQKDYKIDLLKSRNKKQTLRLQNQTTTIFHLNEEKENLKNKINALERKQAHQILKENLFFKCTEENNTLKTQTQDQQQEIFNLKEELEDLKYENLITKMNSQEIHYSKPFELISSKAKQEKQINLNPNKENVCNNAEIINLQTEMIHLRQKLEDSERSKKELLNQCTCVNKNTKSQNCIQNIVQQASNDFFETKIQQIFNSNVVQQSCKNFSEKEIQQDFIWNKTEQHENKIRFESSENNNTHDLNEVMDEYFQKKSKINLIKKKSKNKKQTSKGIESINQEINPSNQIDQLLLNEEKQFVLDRNTESNEENIKDENKIKTEKITSNNTNSIKQHSDSNMIQEYIHNNQTFISNKNIMKQTNDINYQEKELVKQQFCNDIIQLLDQCVPLHPSIKELNEAAAYGEIIKSLTNMRGKLIVRLGYILVEYDLDFIFKVKDLLERKNELVITDLNDQYDLFLLHHGSSICCRSLLEAETIPINPNTKGYKKAMKQYKNIVNQINHKHDKIQLAILEKMESSKMKLKCDLFAKNEKLYTADPYEYESMIMTLGQLAFGSAEILNSL